MNSLDEQYLNLVRNILTTGIKKSDRTGTGTISLFGSTIRHNMSSGFPLLTTKKLYTKGIIAELLWFLSGSLNIKNLIDQDVNIWNGDAYKRYLNKSKFSSNSNDFMFAGTSDMRHLTEEEFIAKIKESSLSSNFIQRWGDTGRIYGSQWRNWVGVDQLQNLINTLKTNPDDRRMIVSAWNVPEILDMLLPPCHYVFQCWARELTLEERSKYFFENIHGNMPWSYLDNDVEKLDKFNIQKRAISLMFNMRSVDIGLGLPFNLASYGLLLSMIAKVVNMVPEELIFIGGDTHIYLNQVELIKEQLQREPYDLPKLSFRKEKYDSIDDFVYDDIIISDYKSHPSIKLPLSN